MDNFARALLIAEQIMKESDYKKLRRKRYASYERGKGKLFTQGKLKLTDLHKHAAKNGTPQQISGQQELYENILNQFL